jgi:lysophospholipase L1-like esterase
VYGLSYPLQDKHILIPTEAAEIKTAVDAMNVKIKAVAAAKGLAFVDANAKMLELSANSGIQYDAVKYSAKFITGGTFSLDGVHLTGRGYALIANEFLRVINAKYHSTLPMVNVNSYSGVTFP